MTNKKNKETSKEVAKSDVDNQKNVQIPQFLSLESTIGAISLLASRSQAHKHLFLSDLEWLVLPAIAQKQFTLFRSEKNEPVAFVSWAKINDEVEKRLLSGTIKLQPKDWNSGDKLYIVDIISPFANSKEILKKLQENQLKDKDVKILRPAKGKKGLEPVNVKEFLEA